MQKKQIKLLSILVILLAISLAVVSYFGVFVSSTYTLDSVSMRTQGIGQDMVDLFFVVPLLLISLILTSKNNYKGILLLAGTLFYILYSFIIYALGVHFNQMFLLYCSTLGLSLFSFIYLISVLNKLDVKSWFSEGGIFKTIGVYFIVVAVMFYILWLKDLIPSVINNTIPKIVSDNKLLVNPVHVIDISFALPGMILSAILLFNKHNLGYIFAAIGLVFTIILTIALVAMVVMLKVKGLSDETSVAGIFLFLSFISTSLLVLYFKRMIKK